MQRHQFRLRDLLIVVTWVAIVLGTVMWTSQHGDPDILLTRMATVGFGGGFASLLMGWGLARGVRVFRAWGWPRTEGTIARYWARPIVDDAHREQHWPIFSFRDGADRRVVVLAPIDVDPQRWPRGTPVEVCYDPNQPHRAELVALLHPSLRQAVLMLVLGAGAGGVVAAILYHLT